MYGFSLSVQDHSVWWTGLPQWFFMLYFPHKLHHPIVMCIKILWVIVFYHLCSLQWRDLEDVSRNHLKVYKVCIRESIKPCILSHPSLCPSLCLSCGLGGDLQNIPHLQMKWTQVPPEPGRTPRAASGPPLLSDRSALLQLTPAAQPKSDTQPTELLLSNFYLSLAALLNFLWANILRGRGKKETLDGWHFLVVGFS